MFMERRVDVMSTHLGTTVCMTGFPHGFPHVNFYPRETYDVRRIHFSFNLRATSVETPWQLLETHFVLSKNGGRLILSLENTTSFGTRPGTRFEEILPGKGAPLPTRFGPL